MASTPIAQRLRQVLEKRSDASALPSLLAQVDRFCVDRPASEQSLVKLEEELQVVHQDFCHSSLHHTEVFLSVLYHLSPALSPNSVISTWWDLVLRRALRIPKLSTAAVNHAKELINVGLQKSDACSTEKTRGFRRRLLDLYLHDAYNEGSAEDILGWSQLDKKQREEKMHWKSNLEDVLLAFGMSLPAVRCPKSLRVTCSIQYLGIVPRTS